MLVAVEYFCRDKIRGFRDNTFVATKDVFYRDKHVFVVTKVSSSRQNFCCDKICLSQQMSKICLLRQKMCFIATKDVFCRDKNDICSNFRQ